MNPYDLTAGSNKKVWWKCSKCQFVWEASISHRSLCGSGCPRCSGNQPLTLDIFRGIASRNGGKCLSDSYYNGDSSLVFQCSSGHVFSARAESVRSTDRKGVHSWDWCPDCRHIDISWYRDHAISMDGKCLSKKYLNGDTQLKFICSEGHSWTSPAGPMRRNKSWCHICACRSPDSINKYEELAQSKGWILTFTKYESRFTVLEFICSQGHRFSSSAYNIKYHNVQCEVCRNSSKMDWFHTFAKSKGGVCLSSSYVNPKTILKFRCKYGHEFETRAHGVRYTNNWCNQCHQKTRRRSYDAA